MDDSHRSVTSVATTRGGVEFDDLASEKVPPYYAFNLTELREGMDLRTATDTLIKSIDGTLRDIETLSISNKRISKFYIGKTYTHKVRRIRQFDRKKQNTWKKGGISSRWHYHKSQDYGKSGMVVQAVVTKEVVPPRSTPAFRHQEMYALALEQQLIIHYAYVEKDPRLGNTSTHPGMQQTNTQELDRGAIGYPIYVAYALEDDNDSENDVQSDCNDPPAQSSSTSYTQIPTNEKPNEDPDPQPRPQSNVRFSKEVTICIPESDSDAGSHSMEVDPPLTGVTSGHPVPPLAGSGVPPSISDETIEVRQPPTEKQTSKLTPIIIDSDSNSDSDELQAKGVHFLDQVAPLADREIACPFPYQPPSRELHIEDSRTHTTLSQTHKQIHQQSSSSNTNAKTFESNMVRDCGTVNVPNCTLPVQAPSTIPISDTLCAPSTLSEVTPSIPTPSHSSPTPPPASKKRRHRCGKCSHCKAPKSGTRINCRQPHRHKACQPKICTYLT